MSAGRAVGSATNPARPAGTRWWPEPGATAGRVVHEIRFFVPGRGPVLVDARRRRRRDRYHCASLTEERSFKLRGTSGKGELKVLTGRSPAVEVAPSVAGHPEQWTKYPVRLTSAPDDWVELTKEIWRSGPVEITLISGDLGPWWTLAAQVHGASCPLLPDDIIRQLVDHHADLRCLSYAAWLTGTLRASGRTSSRNTA